MYVDAAVTMLVSCTCSALAHSLHCQHYQGIFGTRFSVGTDSSFSDLLFLVNVLTNYNGHERNLQPSIVRLKIAMAFHTIFAFM